MKNILTTFWRYNQTSLKLFGNLLLEVFVIIGICLAFIHFKSFFAYFISIFVCFMFFYFIPQISKVLFRERLYVGRYRETLLAYAKNLKCNLKDIYENSTNKLGACSYGFGKNKVICFSSGTFEQCSLNEIQAVMTHEIGHHHNEDLRLYTLMGIFVITLCYLSSLFIIRDLYRVITLIEIIMALSVPIYLGAVAFVRWRETMADAFAINHLVNTTDIATYLKKVIVEDRNNGIVTPVQASIFRRLVQIHPWIYDRIKRFS